MGFLQEWFYQLWFKVVKREIEEISQAATIMDSTFVQPDTFSAIRC